MAPVLSFTADELWQHLPAAKTTPSVLIAGLPAIPAAWRDAALATHVERVLAVRTAASKAIEEARQQGLVKQPSEVRLVLRASGALGQLLAAEGPELATLLLVSEVVLADDPRAVESPLLPGLGVLVERATGAKCARCWLVRPLGADPRHPTLCSRCAGVLA